MGCSRGSESDSTEEDFVEEASSFEIKKYICPFKECDKAFNRLDRLTQHERVHTGERPYKCTEKNCGKSYARSSHLKRHVEQSHVMVRTPADVVICQIEGCQKTFVSEDNLRRHVAEVHEQANKGYLCTVEGCGKTFSKRFQLRSHRYEHLGVQPFQCHVEGCKKQFKQKSHLSRHLKIHDGYKCDVDDCGDVFEKWSELRRHKALQHKKVENCEHCKKSFTSHNKLNLHRTICVSKTNSDDDDDGDRCHSISRPEDDSQQISGRFVSDVNVRDAKSPYPCHFEGCPRSYTRQINLTNHIKVCHTKSVEFKCDWPDCNTTFASKQKKQKHEKMHREPPAKEKKPKKITKTTTPPNEIQMSDICENFENLNSPFVYLERWSRNPPPKLFTEEMQSLERLRRLRRKLKKKAQQTNTNQILLSGVADLQEIV